MQLNAIISRKAMQKNKLVSAIAIAQVFCLLVTLGMWLFAVGRDSQIDVSLSEWQSKYIEYKDNGWYVDSSICNKDVDLLYGPYIHLDKGSYQVNISYYADNDQTYDVHANSGGTNYLNHAEATLRGHTNYEEYHFEATQDIDNFELVFKYGGKGKFCIQDISMHRTTAAESRNFTAVVIISIIIDAFILIFGMEESKKNTALAIIGMTLLVSLPLFVKGLKSGHDTGYHLMRIEALRYSLSSGQFPVRMSSAWFDGYGYASSIYYGDALLYFPAVLRILGFNIESAYKIFMVSINLATSIIAYFSFKGIFKNNRSAMLVAFAYVTCSYRLVDCYVRFAVGEYSAIMFLPLIALAIYKIYADDIKDWKNYKKNALTLAVGMVGVIDTHILTTEMVCVILLLISLVLIKKTIRPNTIKVYLLAVAQTLLINAAFIIPFFDYYKRVVTNINITAFGSSIPKIQYGGVYVGQYFAFFQNIFGKNMKNVNERFLMSPGPVLMIALIVFAVLLFKGCKKLNKTSKIYFAFAVLTLYAATNLFPWDSLALHSKIGVILAQIQFPWRYVGIAAVFLCLLLGELLNFAKDTENADKLKKISTAIVAVCCFTTIVFVCDFFDENGMVYRYDVNSINSSAIGSGEYLIYGSSKKNIDGNITSENMDTVEVLERKDCYMQLHCRSGKSSGYVDVPIFNYPGYKATDDKGKELSITNGTNCTIRIAVPSGYDGNVTIRYTVPWYWHLSEVISLLSIIGIIALTVMTNKLSAEEQPSSKKKEKNKKKS